MPHRQIMTDAQAGHGRFVSQLTRNTVAVVLAGGRGSRLMQLTDWRSKPAVPFGGKFRIIDFTLSNCINSGVRRIGVATQYKAQSLIRHLQRGWGFLDGRFREAVDILPAQQQTGDSWYKGTADAVFQNLNLMRRNAPRHALILSGDHIYKMDYGRMLADHVHHHADLTIACMDVPVGEASAFGVLAVDDKHRVTAFAEKPADPPTIPGRPDRSLVSMGVYVFSAEFLYEQLIRDADDPASSHDFGKDVIPHCVSRYRVMAHDFAGSSVGRSGSGAPYWRDVGTVDAYWEANIELTKVTPDLDMYDEDWPIWTHQEQLPPAKFVFDDEGRRGMAIDSLVSGGNIISGAVVRRSLLFSRVHVHSYAQVEDSVILPKVDIGRGARLRRTVVDKNCRIPDGMAIGFDPEEDRKHFHVTDGGITLVTPEMLGSRIHSIR
ncbi:MAG: glucose-1-phosphate adenylyltransferase [Candidatus Nitricoxidivorans perseverans]|uniref:Glucose-1-phosphate adenylyltransferase n=1 Tax=Candidatus Nitricoxidivorans perseverans TaxID=2975601 RepID=A0AA49FIY2_9PROT|nr:MAG: glucose-1-phosphate adenylyltransferase [Candidatus Nitricoxidivorans perseverans]